MILPIQVQTGSLQFFHPFPGFLFSSPRPCIFLIQHIPKHIFHNIFVNYWYIGTLFIYLLNNHLSELLCKSLTDF